MNLIARKIEGAHANPDDQQSRTVREIIVGIKVAIKGMFAREEPISERTLKGMDEAMQNMKDGKRSPAADLQRYAKFAE